MNNTNNEQMAKEFLDYIEKLVDAIVEARMKKTLKQKEVEIKRVYNADNYSIRRADVVFTDNSSQSTPIKEVYVQVTYPITVGDKAYLYYYGDKPSNGWIGSLITQSSSKGINAETIEGWKIKVLTQAEYDSIAVKDVKTIYHII